jgi:hypothetical protein
MKTLLKVIAVVGIADAAWLFIDPKSWSRFWTRVLKAAGRNRPVALGLAATELLFNAYLIGVPVQRRLSGESSRLEGNGSHNLHARLSQPTLDQG